MNKTERLINAIYMLIEENSSFKDKISSVCGDMIEIKISNTIGSYYYNSNINWHTIELGVSCIPAIYNMCRCVCTRYSFSSNFHLEVNYNIYNRKYLQDRIFIVMVDEQCSPIPSDILKNIDFLSNDILTNADKLTIFAYSYSLFHEIGHAIYNNQISDEMKREKKADMFSFEMGKAVDENLGEGNNCRLWGLLVGLSRMLLARTIQEEKEDVNHPHTLERINALFTYWGVQNDSYLWEMAFDIIQKWLQQNNFDSKEIWEENKQSFKESFLVACSYFINDKYNCSIL